MLCAAARNIAFELDWFAFPISHTEHLAISDPSRRLVALAAAGLIAHKNADVKLPPALAVMREARSDQCGPSLVAMTGESLARPTATITLKPAGRLSLRKLERSLSSSLPSSSTPSTQDSFSLHSSVCIHLRRCPTHSTWSLLTHLLAW